jgi:prepilin-type processing-associated H-X9-DG protein
MSNLKQINLGLLQYTQDYDEKYPLYYYSSPAAGWSQIIQPYLKSSQILQCPSDNESPNSSLAPTADPGYTDYAYNIWVGGYDPATATRKSGLSLASFTEASLSVIMTDYNSNVSYTYTTGDHGTLNGTCTTSTCTGTAQIWNGLRHFDGANLAFADGHVKWYKGRLSGTFLSGFLDSVYSAGTDGSTSGNNPTFNPAP